jgi:Ca-activated chloride channel family protein
MRSIAGLGLVALFLFAGDLAQACFMRSPLPVQVSNDFIEVEIHDQVCVKKYDCHFFNPNPQAVVGGTCYMEVEPGAQVDNMSLTVDGKETKAELLDVKKANQVFQEIVRQGGSPALLEYYGNQLIQSQVPRIAPNGTVVVKLQYTTLVKAENGLCRLSMLNTNPKALMQPLKKASIKISLKSAKGLKNIYSPTHPIKISESKEYDAVVTWEQENYLPKTPFVFYYGLSDEAVGMNLVAHREEGEKGYFMMMISPTMAGSVTVANEPQATPKDVVFCVDTSGSMISNSLIEQARATLTHCVERLNKGDRFNIVNFSTEAQAMSDGLVEFNEASRDKALGYIKKLVARGGTAIEEALDLSLGQFRDDSRLKMVFFMTDGTPSIGETDPDKLLKGVATKNSKGARIFAFGMGYDVNTKLLDLLARENKGDTDYIMPEEKVESKIGPFFDKLSSPVLTDIRVKISGVEVDEVYPRQIPDLFKGSQIILFGRFQGEGDADVTVTGRVNGEERTFSAPVSFPKTTAKSDFVPRLWGGKKVAFLLSELKKNGEQQELVDEVVRLAKRFGIVTPYTSYLIVDDVVRNRGAMPGAVGNKLKKDAGMGWGQNAPPEAKAPLATEARALKEMEKAQGGPAYMDLADEAYRRKGGSGHAMNVMRYIGSKTFYMSEGTWYDGSFDPDKHKEVKTVKVNSDEYFALLGDKPGLAKYMALTKVVVQFEGTWYRFE